MALAAEEIFDRLDIRPGATVFVKASRTRLDLDRSGTQRLLDALIARLGPEGTLAMPSFPWPNDQAQLPLGYELDLLRTPSRMGLLSELFRMTPGTLRGEHYWWPICARGKFAQHLTAGQLVVRHPFGAGSSARRLLDVPTTIVGMGVTTNYNIIAHVVDAEMEPRYPRPVFTQEPTWGIVIKPDGTRHRMETLTVPQHVREIIKPSELIARTGLKQHVKSFEHAGAYFWAMDAKTFYDIAMRQADGASSQGHWPVWLKGLNGAPL
jgi:aminoglycoside N3'-acetyltransferase